MESEKKLKKTILQIPSLRKKDGNWAKNNKEKAKTFADHLEEVFMPNNIKADLPKKEEDNRNIEHYIVPFSQREIKEENKILKSEKPSWFDLIKAEILNQLPKTD